MNAIFRASLAAFVAPAVLSSMAWGQSDTLVQLEEILETTASPFLLPMEYASIKSEGDTVSLSGVTYAGMSIDEVTFDMISLDGERVKLSNFNFPASTQVGPDNDPALLSWSNPSLNITYNLATSAPEAFSAKVSDVSLSTPDDEASGFLTSLNFNVAFDGDTLKANFASGKGTFAFEDTFETVSIPIPDSEFSYTASGYEAGENPLATTGPQIEWMIALFAGDLDVSTPPYVIANQFDLAGRISPIEIVVPDAGLTLSYGETTISGEGRELNEGEASTMQLNASIDGWTTSDPASGADQKVDRLSISYKLDGWDLGAMMQLYDNPSYTRLMENFGQLIEQGDLVDEADLYQGVALSDIIQVYADVFSAFGRLDYQISLEGLEQGIPGISGGVRLDKFDMGLALDLRDPADGRAGVNFGFAGIDVPSFLIPAVIAAFIPSEGGLSLEAMGMDIDSLRASFADWEAQGGSFETLGQEAEGLFQSWFESLDLRVIPSLSLITEPTTLSAGGELSVDTNAAYGVTGSVLAQLTDFAELQQLVSELAATSGPDLQQVMQGAVLGLGFLGGFGDLDEEGTLSLDLAVDQAGSLSVNGLPLPF